MDLNKLPGWSAMIIVPVVILGAALPAILRSSSPLSLGFLALATSLVVGAASWGILSLLGRNRTP